MRVCLDTNVLVSGIFWKGVPGRILDAWVEKHFELLTSPSILVEYQRVMKRLVSPKDDTELIDTWMTALIEHSIMVLTPDPPRSWSRDKNDDQFVDCAIIGQADYLVSGDKDLLVLNEQMDFEIITAKQFVAIL